MKEQLIFYSPVNETFQVEIQSLVKQNVPLSCIDMPSSDIDRPTSYVKALVPRQIALLRS